MEDLLEAFPEDAIAGKVGEPAAGDKYIHVRVADDSGFDRIRTSRFGKGILARIGFKAGKSQVISLLFDKKRWTSEKAREWYKGHKDSLASLTAEWAAASIYVEPEMVDTSADSYGFTIPEPTITKAYAVFRLFSFHPVINQRHDTFDEADVTEEAVESLQGTPIFGNEELTDHWMETGERGPQIGAVLEAKRRKDGLYALAAFYKESLAEHYDLPASELTKAFSVSMEVKFDPNAARYQVGDKFYIREDAVALGIASPNASKDDPRKFDARFLVPVEYHAVALLQRGRNADPTADVLLAAASKENDMPDQIEWHEEDFASLRGLAESLGAELTSERRKNLNRSDFAYVDKDGKGHLPIHDAAHVRNALARLNQTKIPPEAKRSAFRKILAAARRFGIDVDKDSDIYKAYAALHHHSPEERRRILRRLLKRKRKKPADAYASDEADGPNEQDDPTFEVLADSFASVLLKDGETILRADLGFDEEDELRINEVVEIGRISMEQKPMSEEITITQEAALKEREDAVRAELEQAFRTRETEIAKAAVEAFKNSDEFKSLSEQIKTQAITEFNKTRETIASRVKELVTIHPAKDDADRQALENRVAESVGSDVDWLKLKEERLNLALAAAKAKVAPRTVPTLVAKASVPGSRNIFDFTDEAEE